MIGCPEPGTWMEPVAIASETMSQPRRWRSKGPSRRMPMRSALCETLNSRAEQAVDRFLGETFLLRAEDDADRLIAGRGTRLTRGAARRRSDGARHRQRHEIAVPQRAPVEPADRGADIGRGAAENQRHGDTAFDGEIAAGRLPAGDDLEDLAARQCHTLARAPIPRALGADSQARAGDRRAPRAPYRRRPRRSVR